MNKADGRRNPVGLARRYSYFNRNCLTKVINGKIVDLYVNFDDFSSLAPIQKRRAARKARGSVRLRFLR